MIVQLDAIGDVRHRVADQRAQADSVLWRQLLPTYSLRAERPDVQNALTEGEYLESVAPRQRRRIVERVGARSSRKHPPQCSLRSALVFPKVSLAQRTDVRVVGQTCHLANDGLRPLRAGCSHREARDDGRGRLGLLS
mgnify:FL=1